jgi:hypothetical protein
MAKEVRWQTMSVDLLPVCVCLVVKATVKAGGSREETGGYR